MSTQAIELRPQDEKLTVTSEQMTLARNTVAKDLDDNQFALFCYNCRRLGVHPLDGLLVPIVRNDSERQEKRLTFVNTVDLLRSRAAETGDYAGSDDAKFEYNIQATPNLPSDAFVTVWKFVQGERCPFSATARWEEYYPGEKQGFMWRNKPHVMLGKCAEALALRKAFPKQLAGLYIPEELQKEIETTGGKGQKHAQKSAPKPTGDVMCNECRAVNGHLPSCPHRKENQKAPEPQTAQAEVVKEDVPKWLVQISAVDKRERTKNNKKQEYRILTGINAEGKPITIYAWDTKHYEQLDAIKGETNCVFVVKSSESNGKTYYSLDSIVEISGQVATDEWDAPQTA